MDRLNLEVLTETKKTVEVEKQQDKKKTEKKSPVSVQKAPPKQEDYIHSFEKLTVADVKKQQEEVRLQEGKKECEELTKQYVEKEQKEFEEKIEHEEKQDEETQDKPVNIIEKPNYDLIQENRKVKLSFKKPERKRKRLAGLAMALVIGVSAGVCIANATVIDNLNTSYIQLDEQYKLNLGKYLQNLTKIDTAKKGLEFVETYPEEILDAGDLGKTSNWFDKLCSFIGGLFGG